MQLTQALRKGLAERPSAEVIVSGARRVSFAELHDRASRLAAVLQGLGLQPGDRVGMMALNSDAYVVFLYGAWWAGGVINPVNIRWAPAEVAYSLDDCDTRILLVDDAFKDMAPALRERSKSLAHIVYVGDGETPPGMHSLRELSAAAQPTKDAQRGGSDLAAIMYTGGTTGAPKGVMLSHANLYISALSTLSQVGVSGEMTAAVITPMFHVAGVAYVLIQMHRLSKMVILPAFDEIEMLEAVVRERVTEINFVPTMLKRLLDHPKFPDYDLSSLRVVIYGASPIDESLLRQAIRVLPPGVAFSQAYGMTELSPTITILPAWCHEPGSPMASKLRSAGRPVPIAEVRIVDADDQPVPPGTVGEIVSRGPQVMQGYWNKPEQTAEALRGGWMHTGDGGFLDEDGYLHVVDRIKDMIVSGGENVYSAEVENVLLQLPQVAMCAVVGVPDEKWGERVHAVIVLRPGESLTEKEITAFCKERIAGYKCPRSVEFRTELPVSAAGKLLKYQLRETYWQGRDRKVG